ncbi:MAG: RNA-directed DNA polymerase [Verrucomicrobiales bacterium]|nr:RNA-directed DNA polymerase [Verrucomicrobiales bacterium]
MSLDRVPLVQQLVRRALDGRWESHAILARWHTLGARPCITLRALAHLAVHCAGRGIRPTEKRLIRTLLSSPLLSRWLRQQHRTLLPLPPPAPKFEPVEKLAHLALPPLTTETDLAQFFHMELAELSWHADPQLRLRHQPDGRLQHYTYRWLPRRNGSPPPRLLEIPKPWTRQLQRRIWDQLLRPVPVHAACHGFVPGRSRLTAAAPHCGKEALLRIDLKDFFVSIPRWQVRALWMTLGYPEAVARLLAGLCTTVTPAAVLDACPAPPQDPSQRWWWRKRASTPHLPQGSPCSPALANLCAWRLDTRLTAYATAAGLDYTRYADDLLFSGSARTLRRPQRRHALMEIIRSEGFCVHPDKVRLMTQSQSQQALGLVLNQRLNLPRASFDQLKAELHHALHHQGLPSEASARSQKLAQLRGRIQEMIDIHPRRGQKLLALWQRLLRD